VPQYRCYVRDRDDKAGPPFVVEAEDDADALNKAAANVHVSLDFPLIEVWQGSRLVGQIPQRDHVDPPLEESAVT
jgi:hypothetical protein